MNNISIPLNTNSTCVMIQAPIGARLEPKKYAGISHFLEHMAFKGTTSWKQKDIARNIKAVGGVLNAYTDWDATCYWARVPNEHIEIARKTIYELATCPIIPYKEVEKEREVIIQEYKMYQDQPASIAYELFLSKIFKSNANFLPSIIGTPKTLNRITKNILKDFWKQNYKNLITIEIGKVKENSTIKFPDLWSGNICEINQSNYQKIYYEKREISQASMILGGAIYKDIDPMKKLILNSLLTEIFNGMNGRLHKTIREKYNMVYGISLNLELVAPDGIVIWTVDLGLEKKNITKAYDLILKELLKPITDSEIEEAIVSNLGSMQLMLDNPCSIASLVSKCLLLGIVPGQFLSNYEDIAQQLRYTLKNWQKDLKFINNTAIAVTPK